MKKFFTFYLTYLVILSCGSTKTVQSYWHDDNYTKSIAGKLKFDSQSGFMYAISNDEENLCINLRIMDKEVQRKIFMMGMTVWIDTLGKKQENLGITFPLGMRDALVNARKSMPGQQAPQAEQRPSRQDYRNRMLSQLQKIKLTGFNGVDEIQNTNEAIPGVLSGKIERDEMDIMQYTLVIPFERVQSLKNKNGFTIGVKTRVIDMAEMSAMRERMAQGSARSGGISAPRENRPGEGRFSSENLETLRIPSELWIKNIHLAKN